MEKQVLDAEQVQGFIAHAIETHREAAEIKTAIDLGAKPALRESDDGERIELHPVADIEPDSLLIADIPVINLMPTMN